MTPYVSPGAASNPFSAGKVDPGSIPFCFPPGQSAAEIVGRLAAESWWGEIVGPHGSGKSTLLAALGPALAQAGRRPLVVTLHRGQRRLPPRVLPRRPSAATQIVVDGYEQLGAWARWRLRRWCQKLHCGLLVTTHESVGLPTIYTTATTPELARYLARYLGGASLPIRDDQVDACFARHGGDLRETLFALYDLYERQVRDGRASTEACEAKNAK